jgi:hypothetical protein
VTQPFLAGAADETSELEGGFSRQGLGWLIGSVAVSFVAYVLLGVYDQDLERRPTPEANTFSYSALGHRGLADFLRSMGLGVVSRQAASGGGLGPRHPLILAEPLDTSRMKELSREAGKLGAPLVLVLPKWSPGLPSKEKPEWLSKVELLPLSRTGRAASAFGEEGKKIEVLRVPKGQRCSPGEGLSRPELGITAVHLQLLKPAPGLASILGCPGGLLIARLETEPPVYLIADPDILNNQGLGRGDNAAAVYGFLTWDLGAAGVVFDETIHGFHRASGLLAEALRFPLALATLQSLLLLGVVLWAGMGRFGKPLPPPTALAAGKETLIDNTAKLLASGGHAADSLQRYFVATTRAVAAHYFLPLDLAESERLARLQRLADRRGGQGLDLAALERSFQELPPGRRGEERAARIARQLHDWRGEMTNGD